MSIISVVFVPEGIVMASDSRLTLKKTFSNNNNINNNIIQYMNSNNSQKLFALNKTKVGISSCGDAIIEGNTVGDFIRKFEIEVVEASDTVENVAEKLQKYLLMHPADTQFFICGYNNDIPYFYFVTKTDLLRKNILDNGDIAYGADWHGSTDAAHKLLSGASGASYIFNLMPLKDAIEFGEFVIELTIKYERFTDILQVCGGDIDILVITKDDIVFYRHKIYNP